ncbi:MAG: GNAT family N-acetyltransferase [Terricaulis sp.]
MLSEAFRASVIGPPASSRQTEAAGWKPAVQAFLIAFDQTANYSSPNFLWFRERFARFVYVDRIVVAEEARKQGLARTLYQDVFDAARAAGHERVACEVNYAPPNSVSDAFHESLGFTEIGRAALAKDKGVRYLMASLT